MPPAPGTMYCTSFRPRSSPAISPGAACNALSEDNPRSSRPAYRCTPGHSLVTFLTASGVTIMWAAAIACGLPRRSSKECRSRWLVLEGLDRATPESDRATRGPPVLTAHLLAVATAEGASPRGAREPAEAPAGSETPGHDYARALPARRLAQPGGRTPPPPLPPPPLEMMTSLAQRKAESARKRARLSPQAFLEEVLSPEHMQTSSVGLGTVEICDAMTMTGSEQLLAGDGGASSADGAEEHERLGSLHQEHWHG